ncbi:MAG: TonB-dependent receptor [Bacteroidales bacterium]|nr:TonB-dependent receptor [Bacteroidales bacterium]
MKSKLFASLLALFLGVTAFAQNTITGVVSDNIGPAAGVSVMEQGTTNGTITDLDGKFSLNVRNGATIVVSSIGYKDQVIVVGDQRQFTILIEEDNELLDEVVVVGYGVQKKKLVTGSTVQVKGDELAKINSTSALGAMQSSTPGVQISNSSGQPGEGYNVNIRGMGTTGSYQPLYVIDGVPGGDINALNPSDIESIDVLKDAASSAIYGARGANGVILVTTKQGKSGKYSVSYDGFYGWQNSPKLPDLLDAKQYMEVQNMVKLNNGEAMIDWANVLSPDLYNSIANGTYTGTDWLRAIHNDDAPITNHAINISGGSERSKFSFGVSYTGQEGIFGKPAASKYDRTTVRLNSDHVLWQKDGLDIISFGENFTFTYSKKSGIGIGNHYWNDIYNMLVANPIAPMYNGDGGYAAYDEYEATGLWNLDNTVANPIYMMTTSSRGNNWSNNYGLNMSVNLRVQPIKNLVWRSQFNFKQSSSTFRQYDMIFKAGNGNNMRNSDSVSQSASAGWNWSWENTINYKFNVAQDHNFDILAGTSIEHSGYGESVGAARATGAWPNDPTHAYVSNMTGDITSSNITGSPWGDSGLVSFFGRVNYDYKERYLLSLIIRRDGSSNFMKGHRWGTFPSVSAGWVMSNEDWWQSSAVNFFKIRGSWGQNGNCAVDNFQYLATVAIGPDNGGYAFGHGAIQQWQVGSYADKLSNEDISWETSQQLDFGFDARFFNDRLTAAFDWYQKDTKDWLVNAPVMGHFGANAPYINGGEVRNSGIELAINWNDAVSKDFSYSIGINGAYNKNKVTRIANEEGIIHGQGNVVQGIAEMYRAQVGYPIGYFWTYATDGIFQNQAEIDAWKAEGKPTMAEIPVPGDVKFVDLNGDHLLDDKDKTMTGDPNPDFTAGLNISVYFKGFDFALSGYGQFGQQVFRAWRRYSDSMWNNYTTEVYSYWHGEGTSNKLPRLVPGTNYNYMNNSDIFIEDASFFRIQTLTLGYDFKRLWKNAPFEKCRLYVQAQNPFCFTKYKGMDPEVGSSSGFDSWTKGIDLGFYPQARTILVGLNLNF